MGDALLPRLEFSWSQRVGGTWDGVWQSAPQSPGTALLVLSPLQGPASHRCEVIEVWGRSGVYPWKFLLTSFYAKGFFLILRVVSSGMSETWKRDLINILSNPRLSSWPGDMQTF